MIRSIAAAALFLVASAGRAAAQENGTAVSPGSRVRVTAPEVARGPLVGRVLMVLPDTLVTEIAPDSARAVPLAAIRRLEVSRGRQRERGFWTGAAIGLGVSAAVEAAILLQENRNPPDGIGISLIFPVMLAPVVTLVGGLVGASRAPDRWEEVEVPGRVPPGAPRP